MISAEKMPAKNNAFCKQRTLNCCGRLADISTPVVMGILNVTPDSFYDGGRLQNENALLSRAEQMLAEGALFLDIGGMSTRPGAAPVSVEEEMKRVIPAVKAVAGRFPDAFISVDTGRAQVARAAVGEGAVMINDISAGRFDDALFAAVAELKAPYVLMHMQGTPETMQAQPNYRNVTVEVMDFFIEKLNVLKAAGVTDVLLDPGFGFGKTVEHNYTLLRELRDFQMFGLPVVAGISRKSMICKPLKVNPENALNGTTAMHALALLNGADILRAHDVKEAREVTELMKWYRAPEGREGL